jgi:transcription elongation factor Elf1
MNKDILFKYLKKVINTEILDKSGYFNFRCPFCGDSAKNKRKKRGSFHYKNSNYFYRCFNCGISLEVYSFFKELDYISYKELKKEILMNSTYIRDDQRTPEDTKNKLRINHNNFLDFLNKNYKIKNSTRALNYLIGRGILISNYIKNNLYYTDKLELLYEKFFKDKKKVIYGEGILIPTYNLDKEVNGFQIRLLNNNKLRYVTLKFGEGDMIFNLPNLNPNERIIINEGFFDGQFLKNSLNTSLPGIKKLAYILSEKISKENITIVLDNENSKEIISLMNLLIKDNFNVFIWPKEYKNCKDINELYLKHFVNRRTQLFECINKNTFNNIKAKINLIKWRQ